MAGLSTKQVGSAPSGMKWDASVGGYVPITQPNAAPAKTPWSVAPNGNQSFESNAPLIDTTPPPQKPQGTAQMPSTFAPAKDPLQAQLDEATLKAKLHAIANPGPTNAPAAPTATANAGSTFMDDAAAKGQQAERDAQIAKLMRELQGDPDPMAPDTSYLSELSTPLNIPPPDFTGINAKSAEVMALLNELKMGRGLGPIDVTGDPAANAKRIAAKREAELSRASESDRQAASGTSGSGDFDSAVASGREKAAADISNFEGTLANQRHGEQLNAALTGANLQLGDLGRQTQAEEAKYSGALTAEQARRSGIATRANASNETYRTSLAAKEANRARIQALIQALHSGAA